jgi:hypothetical protein
VVAADLAAELPLGSRFVGALNPEASWTLDQCLLAGILNAVRGLTWGLGGGKGKRPKPVEPPRKKRNEHGEYVSLSTREVQEMLNHKRTEVKHGNN